VNSAWRDGGHYPGLLLELGERDFDRVGNCWLKSRLLVGDLALCLRHSGDAFWTYCLVNNRFTLVSDGKSGPGYQAILPAEFSAYVLGTPWKHQPNAREAHLLMAGEKIRLESEMSK
jgi:hypothetical protein